MPDEHDDERQRPRGATFDELADERADQARLLGDADAEHRHEDDADDAEAGEVATNDVKMNRMPSA